VVRFCRQSFYSKKGCLISDHRVRRLQVRPVATDFCFAALDFWIYFIELFKLAKFLQTRKARKRLLNAFLKQWQSSEFLYGGFSHAFYNGATAALKRAKSQNVHRTLRETITCRANNGLQEK
jgi:hypothetical protein